MNHRRNALIGAALVLILFLAVNLASGKGLRGARLDLTENKLYTLSEGARRIAAELEEPVTLTLYWTESLSDDAPPGFASYAQRVEELLEEFATASDGKILLEVVDPEPYSDAEMEAVNGGVRGVRINNAGDVMYFGIVGTNSLGQKAAIRLLSPATEAGLEYDIARLVHELARPDKPVVGVLSSLPLTGSPPSPLGPGRPRWRILDTVERFYELRHLSPGLKEIAENIDLLLLVHPKNLSEEALFAIDQFVMRGGRLVCFVDPFCLQDQPVGDQMQQLTAARDSNLNRLFEAWGFEQIEGKIAADRKAALRRNMLDPQTQRPVSVEYPHVLELTEENVAADEFAVSSIRDLFLVFAGALQKKEDADVRFTPLVFTSEESMLLDETDVRFNTDPRTLLQDWLSSGASWALAARVDGRFPSAFPDGPPGEGDEAGAGDLQSAEAEGEEDAAGGEEDAAGPPAPGEEEEEAGWLRECREENTLVVVADVDMLHESNWMTELGGGLITQTTSQNASLLLNLLDFLSGSNALISIRARGDYDRPFERVEELRRRAEADALEKQRDLEARLRETEKRIGELLSQADEGMTTLPEEVLQEIDKAQQERVRIGRELRDVQYELVRDIEALGSWVNLLNIAGVPALILLAAILRWILKRN